MEVTEVLKGRRFCLSGLGAWTKTSCSYSMAFSQPRKGHAWIPGVVLVRALQKRCTEPGVGDRCISDASETREVLDRNLAIHRCKQSLAQASWYWFVCLENVMDAWWEISELKEISTVPKVYIVLWDSIYRLTTYGPSKLIFPGSCLFTSFNDMIDTWCWCDAFVRIGAKASNSSEK